MRKIKIDDWNLFSKRRNSYNYFNDDKSLILKTSSKKIKITLDEFEAELNNSDKVSALGINIPKALEIVELDCGGYGIISECIKNKKSISTAISEDFENAEFYIKKFVDASKKLHSTKCDTTAFPSFEEKIEEVINSHPYFTNKIKEKIRNHISKIEKTDTCLHMDFQYSNLITSDRGDFFIDLGDFAYGNPIYDVATLFFFTSKYYVPFFISNGIFKMNTKKRSICWRLFLKHYYGMTNEKEIKEFEKMLMPYGVISFLVLNGVNEASWLLKINANKL